MITDEERDASFNDDSSPEDSFDHFNDSENFYSFELHIPEQSGH